MSAGEFLTRGTIWVAILAYTVGSAAFAFSWGRPRWDSAVRFAWTIGCASLIAHTIFAFHYYHSWSHTVAYQETARQTKEVFGLNWGGGLFINYALVIGWTVDIAWWWLSGLNSYRRRPWWLVAGWHWFLIFIILNATVSFETGVVRWVGLFIFACLSLSWLIIAKRRSVLIQ